MASFRIVQIIFLCLNQSKIVVHIKGHQYKVCEGDLLFTERVDGDVGQSVNIDTVLLVGGVDFTLLGRPLVSNASITATIEEQTLTDKIVVFKKKRRKGYERQQGHRQQVTALRIDKIVYQQQQ